MARTRTQPARRRRGSERGSVLVELTLITPLLVLLVMGMLEIGMAWRDSVTVTQASRQGARVGSHLGNETTSDQELLNSLRTVLQPEDGRIDFVVVYKADASGDVPAACTGATPSSQTNLCNVYTQVELAELGDATQWGCGGGTNDNAWCPTDRIDDDEYLGVYIEFDRPRVTGIFGPGSYTLKSSTVMRIEPEYN